MLIVATRLSCLRLLSMKVCLLAQIADGEDAALITLIAAEPPSEDAIVLYAGAVAFAAIRHAFPPAACFFFHTLLCH